MESNPATGKSSEHCRLSSVVIAKELHSVIGAGKDLPLVTTYDKVLDCLKKYIWEKKLYDPHNPYKVSCKDDALGTVLGVAEFTVYNVKNCLQRLILPVNKISKDSAEAALQSVSDNPLKRKLLEKDESDIKKDRTVLSPMILQIPPSPKRYESDSPDSLQGYETAFAKDTSDDGDSVESNGHYDLLAIEETYNLEYEVETDSSDFSATSDSSDSDSEIFTEVALNAAILKLICKQESDIEFFADNSSEEEDDIEIPDSDDWRCDKCREFNRPLVRRCGKCWKQRLEWLPEKNIQSESRPRKRRKPRKSTATTQSEEAKSVQGSQGSCSSQSCSDIAQNSPIPSSESSYEPAPKLCIMCCSRPADASIIHGKYAHQISCYECGRKLQKQKKRCPVCRRTIERVVHQIINV